MSWSPEDDEDEYGRSPRDVRAASRCKCHGDMPGTCPGPASCPMEQNPIGDDDIDDKDGN